MEKAILIFIHLNTLFQFNVCDEGPSTSGVSEIMLNPTDADIECANISCTLALQKEYKDIEVQVNCGKINTLCDNIETDTQIIGHYGKVGVKMLC